MLTARRMWRREGPKEGRMRTEGGQVGLRSTSAASMATRRGGGCRWRLLADRCGRRPRHWRPPQSCPTGLFPREPSYLWARGADDRWDSRAVRVPPGVVVCEFMGGQRTVPGRVFSRAVLPMAGSRGALISFCPLCRRPGALPPLCLPPKFPARWRTETEPRTKVRSG